METLLLTLFASTVRVSIPLLLAALGGVVSERAGVINIALEGIMLVGAFAAACVALASGSAWLGALAGAGAGVGLAAIYALFVVRFRANQIVAGTAINMFAMGITPFLSKIFYGSTGSTPAVPLEARFQFAPVLWAIVLAFAVWSWLKWTPSGLWIRFAGEKPEALDAAGVRVNRVRWAAVMISGALAGLGGVSLSIFLSSSFSRNMTAGRGFMAIAALIFGKWRPLPTAIACLLFAFADAIQIQLQGLVLWGSEPVPVQFIQVLPYVITILVLAGVVGQSRAPRALGLPFFGR
jgi:ABC-type uncharacterized transport system permease subunit